LTTPDPVLLQQRLRRFVDEGFAACAIEASSIGIAEQRLDATHFQVAVFTNFTQDHLDYHGSMQAYWAAKESLFSWPGLVSAVINLDDAHGQVLAERLKASSLDIWTVSINQSARLQAQRIEQAANTVTFDVIEGADCAVVSTGALGSYNVSNLLGVIGAMRALGVSLGDAAAACCDLPAVPGRLNTFAAPGAPLAVIDYAHTPDAIEKVLLALRPVAQSRGGQLWCVFGCAGDRDAAKRPLMATMAEKYSDCVVVTSDNPRTEDPQSIISQVLPGFQKPGAVHVQADRALAIAQTLARAKPADVVLLAGKGHEDYQEIHGVKYSFEDQLHAQAALSARSSAGAAA
jgi:UDP-N-acetylmuramoyl-L-alanyl-D-glutamate--2,6-diaminopimelate ligase